MKLVGAFLKAVFAHQKPSFVACKTLLKRSAGETRGLTRDAKIVCQGRIVIFHA
jgi:hypothetical protein